MLKKLEWAQQRNVDKKMGGLHQRNTTISKAENMSAFKSSFYTTSEAISLGLIIKKMTELPFYKPWAQLF